MHGTLLKYVAALQRQGIGLVATDSRLVEARATSVEARTTTQLGLVSQIPLGIYSSCPDDSNSRGYE